MADETERKVGRKRIPMPDDPTTIVEVPCIREITFRDPVRRQQDVQFTHDNSHTADRSVHVDNVQSVDQDSNVISNAVLPVERIDRWKTLDPVRRQQETWFSPDNVTGNDSRPPHFSTHKKTQVIRYYEDPNVADNGGAWIDIEWIDEYEDTDPVRRNQARIFTLQTRPGGCPRGRTSSTGIPPRAQGSAMISSSSAAMRTHPAHHQAAAIGVRSAMNSGLHRLSSTW
jgi:hypothetical protein